MFEQDFGDDNMQGDGRVPQDGRQFAAGRAAAVHVHDPDGGEEGRGRAVQHARCCDAAPSDRDVSLHGEFVWHFRGAGIGCLVAEFPESAQEADFSPRSLALRRRDRRRADSAGPRHAARDGTGDRDGLEGRDAQLAAHQSCLCSFSGDRETKAARGLPGAQFVIV